VLRKSWATTLLWVHRSPGATIWALTGFRLAWRWTGARFPAFRASMTALHRLAARVSEYGLYALLLLQSVTGLAQTVLRQNTAANTRRCKPPSATPPMGIVVVSCRVAIALGVRVKLLGRKIRIKVVRDDSAEVVQG
jgi:hypothetical protein